MVSLTTKTGRIFLGMDGGNLTVLENGVFKIYTDFNGRTGFQFNDLYVYKEVLLIGTSEGLSMFDLRNNASPIVEPSFNNFGTSAFHNTDPAIREVFVVNDTIYALNRFFWAKLKIKWDPPIIETNAGTNLNLPGIWTTNGSQGDFAYRILVDVDEYDTTGFSHFFLKNGAPVGLLDQDVFRDPKGGIYGLNFDNSQFWTHRLQKGTGADPFEKTDTLFYANASSGASEFNCLALDDKGTIFVGTNNRGILRLSDEALYWNGDEQSFTALNQLSVDPYGNVYATNVRSPGNVFGNRQTSLGILKYDGEKWIHLYTGHDPNQTLAVNSVALDRNGRIFASFVQDFRAPDGTYWPFHDRGIVVFNNPFLPGPVTVGGEQILPEDLEVVRYFGPTAFLAGNERLNHPNPAHNPTAVFIDDLGRVFLSHSHGLDGVKGGTIRVLEDQSLKSVTPYQNFSINSADFSSQGASAFRQMGDITIPQLEAYQQNGHYDFITTDHAGNIWATLSGNSTKFNVFGLDQNRSNADTLIYDQDESITAYLWRTGGEGIPEAKRGLEALLGAKAIRKIGKDLFGDIWIATASGLHYYSEGKPSTTGLPYDNVDGIWRYFLPNIGINDFDFDSLNNVWIATEGFGLKMLDFSTAKYFTSTSNYGQGQRDEISMKTYTVGDGLMDTRVSSIAVDRRNGKVWLGFANGLQSFDSGIRLAEDISTGYVYPVLFKRGIHQELFLNTNQNESAIAVFTLSGQMVASKSLSKLQSSWKWDTRNPGGNLVTPGVYLYRFLAKNGKRRTGKFAIVR